MRVAFTLFLIVSLHVFSAGATQLSGSETAGEFFDKVAGALLKEELGLELHHVPIYPTNRYSQEMHRLLQVTANLYDSTTNRGDSYPWFPTSFRPRFGTNESEIFIVGYVEETGVNFGERPWHEVEDPNDRPIEPDDNVYGVPIILGAKKGFPNFNEFVVQSVVQLTRKLQFRAPSPYTRPVETNQMFIMGVSNAMALEMWKPSMGDYPRALSTRLAVQTISTLSNENGFRFTNTALHEILTNIPAGTFTNNQFRVPLLVTDIPLSNSVFRLQPINHFDPPSTTNIFDAGVPFPTNWNLATKSRLVFWLTDGDRLVDFVALSDMGTWLNISGRINTASGTGHDFWDPQVFGDVTRGVRLQIEASLGNTSISDWTLYGINQLSGADRNAAIQRFSQFLFGLTNLTVMEAPFSPTAKIVQSATWEANDPFLHQTAQQLIGARANLSTVHVVPPSILITVSNSSTIGYRNRSYSPAGYNAGTDPFAYDVRVKDTSVYSPDWWSFEASSPLSLAAIGRVHRGTPWQSIYLKSGIVSPDEWLAWYGSLSGHPTNDWQLVSVLTSMLNTNAPENLLSINSTNRAAWAMAFEGLVATTNDEECTYFDFTVHSNSSQVSVVLDGIEARRATSSGGYFDHLGAVLATPELSMASSPWMNFAWWWVDCLPDAALETLPSQLLSKLRADPVANIVSSNGPFQIEFRVIPGRIYEIEASDDLQHWQSISTNFVAESSFTFADSPNLNRRFYRVKLVP